MAASQASVVGSIPIACSKKGTVPSGDSPFFSADDGKRNETPFFDSRSRAQKTVDQIVRWTVWSVERRFPSPIIRGFASDDAYVVARAIIWQNHPLAVPEKRIGLPLILAFFDRCASPASLHPPLAALGGAAHRPSSEASHRMMHTLLQEQSFGKITLLRCPKKRTRQSLSVPISTFGHFNEKSAKIA